MRCSRLLIVILLSASCCLEAAEPEFKLPPNGSWTKYRVSGWDSAGNESIGTITFRLLAGPTEDGVKSRWIEFERGLPTYGNPIVEKYLVPETALLRSAVPLREAIRLWYQEGTNLPERLDFASNVRVFEMRNVVLNHHLLFLPQTRKDWKPHARNRVIEYQKGKLDCSTAVIGSLVAGYDSRVPSVRFEVTDDCTIWLHKEIPFGVASAKVNRSMVQVNERGERSKPDPRGKFELEALDWGGGAQSALPDAQ